MKVSARALIWRIFFPMIFFQIKIEKKDDIDYSWHQVEIEVTVDVKYDVIYNLEV